MYLIWNEQRPVMAWNKVLDNGNYDYDDIVSVFQTHRDELGIELSDEDVSEIVNVEGVLAINQYMTLGKVEFYGTNHWHDEWWRDRKK